MTEPTAEDPAARFEVLVLDLWRFPSPGCEKRVTFPSLEIAREYARRRTRDSLEEMRAEGSDPEELRRRWQVFGEACRVMHDSYSARDELDFFIANPASDEERDWRLLQAKAS